MARRCKLPKGLGKVLLQQCASVFLLMFSKPQKDTERLPQNTRSALQVRCPAQRKVMRICASPPGGSICVVGAD